MAGKSEQVGAGTERQWDLPVTSLKGISKARAKQLEKLDITTLGDLACHFPRRYEDWTSIRQIADLEDGEDGVFLGRVHKSPTLFRQGKRSILQTSLVDPSGTIKGVWFNQPYYQDKLIPGDIYLFRGKIKRQGRTFQVTNPQFEAQPQAIFQGPGEDMAEFLANTFVRPVYPTTQGLSQNMLRRFVDQALAKVQDEITEVLPQEIRKDMELASLAWAFEQIHHPDQLANYQIARRRLAFDELLYLQLGLRLSQEDSLKKKALPLDLALHPEVLQALQSYIKTLPFELTSDQKKALEAILKDMNKAVAMNRLLQGDVGSGKTIVAFLAMYAQGLLGRQTAMMAPTGILAKQHERNFRKFFPDLGEDSIACLTSDLPAKEKNKIYDRLEKGEILYLFGTHALIQSKVVFSSLALAITDEQHRFGVKQRLKLSKAEEAHILVMSATPIPRTLGLVIYGDLDVSVLAEKPPGRKPVRTYTARTKDIPRLNQLIRRFVEQGDQVYIVCPMVQESDSSDLQSAESLYEELSKRTFPDLGVGLVHGQLKEKDKNQVMEDFLDQKIQILVSTTVIEVGVDNPRASLMIVVNAERFGLAQLHQLRGRIGRGSRESLCVLQSDVGEGLARKRLTTMCRTDDGFKIAEEDLRLRGPGDFFGTRQHGLPGFRMANLYEDQDLIRSSSEIAQELLNQDPDLSLPEHKGLLEKAKSFLIQREQ